MRNIRQRASSYLFALLGLTFVLLGGFFSVLYQDPLRALVTKAMVRAAVDGPYTGNNGYDYYVVNANIAAEDTGEEVCAAVGLGCIGYTLYNESVCTQVHPSAVVDNTSVDGSKAGYYCDGAPQVGAACGSSLDSCKVCPTCTVGVSCSEPIGALYREMYVQCAGAIGTNGYSAPARPDDIGGDTDFVATTLTDNTTFNTYGVAHDVFTDSDFVLFNDGYTDGFSSATAYDSLGGGVFVVHGHNDGGTGGRELYVAKISALGAVLWDNPFSNFSFYYGSNGVIDIVDDQNGGVYVLASEGDVFGPTNLAPVLYYFNAAGTQVYSSMFSSSTNVGRMVPDGSGGVYVLSNFGYDPLFSATGPGTITHHTTTGLDATYNSGNGFQEVVAGGADVNSIEMISDTSGGIVVLWIGDTSGTYGLHAQHIESDGSIDTDFAPTGALIYADSSAFGSVQATIAGSHVYVGYHSASGIVVNDFFLDLSTAWQCRQSVPSSGAFNIINPYLSSPILMWTDNYGDGNAIFAQVFQAGSGHSLWSIGGEVVDASDNYTAFTNLGFSLDSNPGLTGFGELSGGVELVYTYDDGVGVPITATSINSSSFAAGPGGDCVPVQPPEQVLPADGATVSLKPFLSAQYLAQLDFGVTHYRVSSSSTADCAAGTNLVYSATSYTTESLDQATGVVVESGISNGNTYYWCAQNDDGTTQTSWVEMGDFTVDLTTPHPDYSTFLGGTFQDQPRSLDLDASGVLYIGGQTTSSDFPTTSGVYSETFAGNQDVFVAAIDPQAGGAADLIFATYLGGTDLDAHGFVKVDATNLYVVGSSYSTDFPTTVGAYDTDNPSGLNITTITTLNLDATSLQYSTYFGTNAVNPTDLDVEGGLIYVSGSVFGSNIPTTVGAFDTTLDTSNDAFLMVLDPAGAGAADLLYSTYFGGNHSNEYIVSIDVDGGNFYFGMYSQATNLPTTAGAFDTTYNAGTETFVGVLNPGGAGAADLLYGSYLGGSSSNEQIEGVAFAGGDIYITGYVAGGQPVTFPTTSGAFQTSYAGTATVGFMTILNPGGAGVADLVYSTFIDGIIGSSVATDAGIVYVFGANAPVNPSTTTTANAFDAVRTSQYALALAQIEPLGGGASDLLYATLIEPNDINANAAPFPDGMVLDPAAESVWFLGNTNRGDYPSLAVGGDPYDYNYNGSDDTVITRFTFAAVAPPFTVLSVTPSENSRGNSASSNVVVVFSDSLNTATANVTTLPLYGSIRGLVPAAYTFSTTTVANDTVTMNPTSDFEVGEMVSVDVSNTVQSLSATAATPKVSTFYVSGPSAPGTFGTAVNYTISNTSPQATVSGDYNNDGNLDVLVSMSANIDVFLGAGDGTFTAAAPVTGSNAGFRMVSGDFDRDGNLDFAKPQNLNVAVYLGNGDGTFASAVTYGSTYSVEAVYAADMDGDSVLDLIAGTFDGGFPGNGQVVVYLGNGNGTFQSGIAYTINSGGSYNLGIGDMNGDGFVDVLALTYFSGDVQSFLNDGTGVLVGGSAVNKGSTTQEVLLAPLDADAILDAALSTNGNFSKIIGNGLGGFSSATMVGLPRGDFAAVDTDGDGDLDLLVSDHNIGDMYHWRNNGSASFTSTVYPALERTAGLAVGDFNHDDVIDVAATVFAGGNRLAVYLGNASTNAAPTAPTSLFSNNSNAQAGNNNPTGITSATPVFSAICNDPDVGDLLNKYRIQVDDNNNFSSVVWDSGAAGTSMVNCVAGARSQNITFGGTPLAQDGTTYYWRIKFWDDEPSEGVFSESPTSTRFFTMANSGGGGGGGSSIQRLQQLSSITSPVIGPVTVVSPSTVRFEWSYGNTSSINGFRLINDQNLVATQVASPSALAAQEEGLPHNSLVRGRKVTAYNDSGESAPSAIYPDVYTFMIPVTPKLVSRQGDQIHVAINEELNNLSSGQSGVQFELISVGQATAAGVDQSPWLQGTDYTFDGVEAGTSYLLRSRARNFIATETVWSSTIAIPGEDFVAPAPDLHVALQLTASEGQSLEKELNPNSVLSVAMTVSNDGEGAAENLFLTLPIPDYISYIPGTLSIDGHKQSDAADTDNGQVGNSAVSAVWPELAFGFGHTVRFQLGFDTPRLVEEFVKPLETQLKEGTRLETQPIETTQRANVIAQALAAANPEITMQAQASHSGDANPVYSNPEQVSPNIEALQPAPVAPSEPTPAPVPTPEQVEIIENVLQQEFPQPGMPNNQPDIPTGDTTSNFDGGSFSVDTSSGDNHLSLNGSLRTNDDQIEFTGTTSESFAVVTLIFNNGITAIAVSDVNGNWRTFVSADELGIQEGQEKEVLVEAIAAKGDLRSERVDIGTIMLTRGRSGQIVADFETVVSDQGFITTLQQAAEVIEKQEPAIQTALTVSAPVLVASSVPLWGYLPYVPTLIYHFIGWILGFLGRRKKKDDEHATFGIVYDSITKLPLPLAIVRIYDKTTNKLVSTTVTDKLGRYDVLLAAGDYMVEVSKPQYQFPSSIVTAVMDGEYDRVYQDKVGAKVAAQAQSLPHIPIDPINVKRQWELSFGVRKGWLAFQRLGNHLATPIMVVGFVTALALVYAVPTRPANWIILGLYAITLASQIKLKPKLLKAWGVVYDLASDAILPLVTIQLIEPAGSKVVTSRLSDYEGRFTFLPEPGDYIVKATKPGYSQVSEVVQGYSDRQAIPPQVHIEKPNQRIAGDVAMKQVSFVD